MFNLLQSLLKDPLYQSQIKYITKTFHANEKILKQGKAHSSIYIINKGNVRVILRSEIKDKTIHPGIADLKAGHIFGELGLFDDSPANADVIAITESELIEIDIASFREFLEKNPQIGYKILLDMFQVLVERLRHADKTIVNLYAWGLEAHQIDRHLE